MAYWEPSDLPMTYQNPHAQLTKICPICGNEFQTIAHYNQIYDTIQCYRAGKTRRRVARHTHQVPTKIDEQRELILNQAYFAIVNEPTPAQLDNFAKLILLEMNDDKPIKITGSIPRWEPPKNIALTEQFGSNPKEWLLTYRESSPLDELLGR